MTNIIRGLAPYRIGLFNHQDGTSTKRFVYSIDGLDFFWSLRDYEQSVMAIASKSRDELKNFSILPLMSDEEVEEARERIARERFRF